jgi:hypothetical protein
MESAVVSIEIRCRATYCSCSRMVEARLTPTGYYAAPEGERRCPECFHANPAHSVVGMAVSSFERRRRLSGF